MTRRRLAFARLTALLVAGHLTHASAGEITLDALLWQTAVTPPARVAFVEERHNDLLREPLVLSGYLVYDGEQQLSKVVEAPFEESFHLSGDTVEISRDGGTRRLSLRRNRATRVMLGGIEALLAGDAAGLEQAFSPRVSGSPDRWQVVLEPRSRQVARRLRAITVTGAGPDIESIRFDLERGEWHLLRITERRDDDE